MIEGKTKSGFKYKIPKKNLENYELIESLAEAEENPLQFPKVVNLLLGPEQAKRLKDHVRDKSGVVPAERISEEIQSIFENHNETKNS